MGGGDDGAERRRTRKNAGTTGTEARRDLVFGELLEVAAGSYVLKGMCQTSLRLRREQSDIPLVPWRRKQPAPWA
jgi:hypothetical protein